MLRTGFRRPRRAFTLLELIIVIAVILFVCGLMLPVIQILRQSAARSQSANNMHQMMIALHSYHDAYGKFPTTLGSNGKLVKGWMKQSPAIHGTLFYHILPFVEEPNLQQKSVGMSRTCKECIVSIYIAPADFTVPPKQLTADKQGAISYAANGNVFGYLDSDKGVELSKMWTLPQLTAADGTSNTIALAERYCRCIAKDKNGKEIDYQRAWSEDGKGRTAFAPALWKLGPVPQFGAAMKADPDNPKAKTVCDPEAAQSFDGSILQVAMCDGSVHSVHRKITAQTWSNALQPDDGQNLGPDW